MVDDNPAELEEGTLHEPEGEEAEGEEEWGEDAGPYKPPSFIDALRQARTTGRRPRPRAQPATGTEADAKAVNYVDRRERLIAGFLGVFQLLLGGVLYYQMRHLVVKSSKHPKVTAHQAHLDTLNYHHIAPYVLGVNLLLALAILGGVWAKRRSLVGFTVILAGLGLFAYGGGLIGIVYLGAGIWLIFRARKRQTTSKPAAASSARGSARTGSTSGRSDAAANLDADRRALAAGAARTAAAVRKPPPPSKRYTPPAPRRASAPKLPANPEPEKESRLTSWLRR
jgi:hypothetical protein